MPATSEGFRETGLKASLVAAMVMLLLMSLVLPRALADPAAVFPASSRPYGQSYPAWSANWWTWAVSQPQSVNPLLDKTGSNCAVGQSGPVWFLAGTFSGGSATRSCTVPLGKALLFPVVNVVEADCTVPNLVCGSAPVDGLRTIVRDFINSTTLTQASVDGTALSDVSSFRFLSPQFDFTLPANDIFGCNCPGIPFYAVSDGYWIMLAPLNAGSHIVKFHGAATGADGLSALDTDTTYNLTVR